MKKRVFIVHGWGGYPKEGWGPWLKNELENRGFDVQVPSMPDTESPKLDKWLSHLSEIVGTPDKTCYFVGHSLGCITIFRFIETLRQGQRIGGVVLVAGFTDINITVGKNESVNKIKTFFKKDLDFIKIKSYCKKFIAIHSDNDPYVSLRYADIFKEKLGAKVKIEHHMKHFSGDDGITKLPIALKSVLNLSE